jgi:hypothetical protein
MHSQNLPQGYQSNCTKSSISHQSYTVLTIPLSKPSSSVMILIQSYYTTSLQCNIYCPSNVVHYFIVQVLQAIKLPPTLVSSSHRHLHYSTCQPTINNSYIFSFYYPLDIYFLLKEWNEIAKIWKILYSKFITLHGLIFLVKILKTLYCSDITLDIHPIPPHTTRTILYSLYIPLYTILPITKTRLQNKNSLVPHR